MKKLLIALLGFIPFSGSTQTNCDSLVINCCDASLLAEDTLMLTAHNDATMEIFSYPGFRLIDGSSTIVAEETVNYFGIGFSDQTHYLDVLQPISLPFTGTLELWGGFYDTLYCTFNLTISTSGMLEFKNEIQMYPNPTNDFIFIEGVNEGEFQLTTMDGKVIRTVNANQSVNIQDLPSGSYFLVPTSGPLNPTKFIKH
ncbi:MAG: T9SS type A sorting domain-containing protein [Bacteroidota bacterium]